MTELTLRTRSRTDFVNITDDVRRAVSDARIESGTVTVFVPHTTAGVQINENADPDVMRDMELILDRMVPWHGSYAHSEGNAAAHAKAALMGASVQIIVSNGQLELGTWQGVYFCEFDGPRHRKVWVQ